MSGFIFERELNPFGLLVFCELAPLLTNLLGNLGHFSFWVFSSDGSHHLLIVEHVGRQRSLWLDTRLSSFLLVFFLQEVLAVFTILVDEVAFCLEVLQFSLVSGNVFFDNFEVGLLLVFAQSLPNSAKSFSNFGNCKSWVIVLELFPAGVQECEVASDRFFWHH